MKGIQHRFHIAHASSKLFSLKKMAMDFAGGRCKASMASSVGDAFIFCDKKKPLRKKILFFVDHQKRPASQDKFL